MQQSGTSSSQCSTTHRRFHPLLTSPVLYRKPSRYTAADVCTRGVYGVCGVCGEASPPPGRAAGTPPAGGGRKPGLCDATPRASTSGELGRTSSAESYAWPASLPAVDSAAASSASRVFTLMQYSHSCASAASAARKRSLLPPQITSKR